MTHFEVVLVESIRDLAKEVQETNELVVRLDERSKATERRLASLEEAVAAGAVPPPSRARRRWKATKDTGMVTGVVTALVAAVWPLLHPVPPTPPTPVPHPVPATAPVVP
jgi:hypothetical protein